MKDDRSSEMTWRGRKNIRPHHTKLSPAARRLRVKGKRLTPTPMKPASLDTRIVRGARSLTAIGGGDRALNKSREQLQLLH